MISEMLLSGLSYRSIGLSSADAKHAYAFPLDDNIQREHRQMKQISKKIYSSGFIIPALKEIT